MKLRLKSAVAGVTALALAGAGLAFAGSASAYTGSGPGGAPSWATGDTFRKGAVLFYDAAGNQITGGTNIQNIGQFVGTSGTAPRAGANKATAYLAAPDPANSVPSTWGTNAMLSNYTWSPTPAGTPAFVPNTPGAFVKLNAAGAALEDVASGVVLYTGSNTDYLNVLEIRVQDSGTGVVSDGGKYWATDIEYNPSTATSTYDGLAPGAWRVVWPAVGSIATTTTVSTNPASGSATTATPVTLTATVSPAAAAGSVQFSVDGTPVGGAIAVSGGTASFNAGLLGASAGHAIRADFTPSAPPAFQVGYGSSFGTASLPVTQVQATTATAVTGPTTATVGTSATFTASVTAGGGQVPAGHGTVQFTVNGSNVGSPVPYAGSPVTYSYQPTAAGNVTIGANFTGDAAFGDSNGNTIAVTVSAPAYAPDPQNVTVVVPQGTLVISTPYTVANPLSLGTMVLNAQGTQYSASAPFGDPNAQATADPGQITGTENPPALVAKQSNGVTITDTRANGPGWTASVTANDFSDGSGHSISGDNLTFTQITPKYLPGNAIQSGVAVPAGATVTGFKSATKTFASLGAISTGTVAITATLGLVAPTSTVAGTYTATITFSIV